MIALVWSVTTNVTPPKAVAVTPSYFGEVNPEVKLTRVPHKGNRGDFRTRTRIALTSDLDPGSVTRVQKATFFSVRLLSALHWSPFGQCSCPQ
jgi:hypothetical protein